MEATVKEQIDTLTGGSGNPGENWEEKYHALEKKFDSVRVEEGRVKKLDEELKATRAELEKVRGAKRDEELDNVLTQEERDGLAPEFVNAAKKLVSAGLSRAEAENEKLRSELDRRNAEFEQRNQEEASNRFFQQIDAKYPGFRYSIGEGGDKCQAWKEYCRYNNASITAAVRGNDIETMQWHIETFYTKHLGIQVPSGYQDGSAAPDPRSSGGGSSKPVAIVSGKVYTMDEFNALFDMKEAARDRGDWTEVKRITDEINKAQAEGRVKG